GEGVRVALDGGQAGSFHHISRVVVSSGPGRDAVSYRYLGGPDTKPADLHAFLGDDADRFDMALARSVGLPQPWVIDVRGGGAATHFDLDFGSAAAEAPVRLSAPVRLTLVGASAEDTAHVALHNLTLDAPFTIDARLGTGAASFSLDNQATP